LTEQVKVTIGNQQFEAALSIKTHKQYMANINNTSEQHSIEATKHAQYERVSEGMNERE